jgi:hypothetical protein
MTVTEDERIQITLRLQQRQNTAQIAFEVLGGSTAENRATVAQIRAEMIADAIAEHGDLVHAAKISGISQGRISRFARQHPEIQRALDALPEQPSQEALGELARECVLRLVSLGYSLPAACGAMGRTRQLGHAWRERHPSFDDRLALAERGEYEGPLAWWPS